jgi:hypothetical protein
VRDSFQPSTLYGCLSAGEVASGLLLPRGRQQQQQKQQQQKKPLAPLAPAPALVWPEILRVHAPRNGAAAPCAESSSSHGKLVQHPGRNGA